MFQPFDEKCIVVVKKEFKKEKGKVLLDEDGNPLYDLEQEGTVLRSNIEGIKKGMKVIGAYRGGMPIRKLEDKKTVTVIFERQDIYAVE